MDFEWDPEKEQANLEKHGINFDAASAVFDGLRLERRSDRYGEPRWTTTGEVDGALWTVVYTLRGETIRIISAGRARDEEEREYQKVHG